MDLSTSSSPDGHTLDHSEEPLNDTWDAEWLPRMSALVVGPGLGRGAAASSAVKSSIRAARANSIPIILDADALYTLSKEPEIISGYIKL